MDGFSLFLFDRYGCSMSLMRFSSSRETSVGLLRCRFLFEVFEVNM